MTIISNGILPVILLLFVLVSAFIAYLNGRHESNTNKNLMPLSAGALILFVIGLLIWLYYDNGSLILSIIIITVSFSGMLICYKHKDASSGIKHVAVALVVVIILSMFTILLNTLAPSKARMRKNIEARYAYSAAVVLGRTLAEKYPGGKALVLAAFNYERSKRQMEAINGLEEGFGNKITIEAIEVPVSEEMKKNMGKNKPYMNFKPSTAEDYNKIIARHSDCNLIITLAGLPADAMNMTIWDMEEKDRPKVVLVYTDETKVASKLKGAILNGFVTVLTYQPGVKPTKRPCPSDPQKAFDQRYLIVSKDNLEECESKYKGLFD